MRKTMFKGMNKSGEWIKGSLLNVKIDGKEKCLIVGEEFAFDGETATPLLHDEVYPETVNEWTGLFDDNDTPIFEGDILHCHAKSIGSEVDFTAVVEFGNPNREYSWGWQLQPLTGYKTNMDILCWVETEDPRVYCEVVGNVAEIHDELYRGGENQ